MADQHENSDRIVVGVDGSDSSKDALRWAVRYAEATGGVVQALTAWDFPQFHGALAWLPPATGEREALEAGAGRELTTAVDDVLGAQPPVEVRTEAQHGTPAGVLLAAARGASLLVVGSRGRGASRGCFWDRWPSTARSTRRARSSWSAVTTGERAGRRPPPPPPYGPPGRPSPGGAVPHERLRDRRVADHGRKPGTGQNGAGRRPGDRRRPCPARAGRRDGRKRASDGRESAGHVEGRCGRGSLHVTAQPAAEFGPGPDR